MKLGIYNYVVGRTTYVKTLFRLSIRNFFATISLFHEDHSNSMSVSLHRVYFNNRT